MAALKIQIFCDVTQRRWVTFPDVSEHSAFIFKDPKSLQPMEIKELDFSKHLATPDNTASKPERLAPYFSCLLLIKLPPHSTSLASQSGWTRVTMNQTGTCVECHEPDFGRLYT
jgi:hypothetical protein